MENELIIYHGSQKIVEAPKYGKGKDYNDYGQGFYCTESKELAKEWACSIKNNGYSNKYLLNIEGLNVMHLTKCEFNILNWLAILLKYRKFDITSPIAYSAREFIISHFMPDMTNADVIIGYRADDSYFSFAEDFVNNTISLKDLSIAMQLGTLGEQVVLISKNSFERIKFIEYENVDYNEYYYKRIDRDQKAKNAYMSRKKNLKQLMDDIFILDIIRKDMKNDDPRLRFTISE